MTFIIGGALMSADNSIYLNSGFIFVNKLQWKAAETGKNTLTILFCFFNISCTFFSGAYSPLKTSYLFDANTAIQHEAPSYFSSPSCTPFIIL